MGSQRALIWVTRADWAAQQVTLNSAEPKVIPAPEYVTGRHAMCLALRDSSRRSTPQNPNVSTRSQSKGTASENSRTSVVR
jgi:hypothetical protein